jgi:hypothetical protein
MDGFILKNINPFEWMEKSKALSFLSAMDFVCHEDRTSRQIYDYTHRIDDTIYQDMTNVHLPILSIMAAVLVLRP